MSVLLAQPVFGRVDDGDVKGTDSKTCFADQTISHEKKGSFDGSKS